MPSDSGLVGALQLPLAAGSANARFEDPLLDALLAFVAFVLNDSLNAKLAMHTGLKRGSTVCQAVPTGQTFPFDPTDPQAEKFRLDPPCLFMWWPDDSVLTAGTQAGTVHYDVRQRALRLLWMMPELPSTDQFKLRYAMFQAADAALCAASNRGFHRGFSHNNYPLGTPVAECVAPLGTVSWRYVGGRATRWGLNDRDPTSSDLAAECKRDWLCLAGSIAVTERVEHTTPQDPGDVAGELTMAIEGCSESLDPIPIMDRYLDAPDGSEQEDGDPETE